MKTITIVLSIVVLAALHASAAPAKCFKSAIGHIKSPVFIFSTGGHTVAYSQGARCESWNIYKNNLIFKNQEISKYDLI